jgi:plasmid stabilization system protein ParE
VGSDSTRLRLWRKHRDKAPSAFDDDLFEALALLRTNPGIGEPVRLNRGRARRYWLDRIRYFIYYREVADDVIEISSIKHGARR